MFIFCSDTDFTDAERASTYFASSDDEGPLYRHRKSTIIDIRPFWEDLLPHMDGQKSETSSQTQQGVSINNGQLLVAIPIVLAQNYHPFYRNLIKLCFNDIEDLYLKHDLLIHITRICQKFPYLPHYHMLLGSFLEGLKHVKPEKRKEILLQTSQTDFNTEFNNVLDFLQSHQEHTHIKQKRFYLRNIVDMWMFRRTLSQKSEYYFDLEQVKNLILPKHNTSDFLNKSTQDILTTLNCIYSKMDMDNPYAPNYLSAYMFDEYLPALPTNAEQVEFFVNRARHRLKVLFSSSEDTDGHNTYLKMMAWNILTSMHALPESFLPLPFASFVNTWFYCHTSQIVNLSELSMYLCCSVPENAPFRDKLRFFLSLEKSERFSKFFGGDLHAKAKFENDLDNKLGFIAEPAVCNYTFDPIRYTRGPQTVFEEFLMSAFTPASLAKKMAYDVNYQETHINPLMKRKVYLEKNRDFYLKILPGSERDSLSPFGFETIKKLCAFKIQKNQKNLDKDSIKQSKYMASLQKYSALQSNLYSRSGRRLILDFVQNKVKLCQGRIQSILDEINLQTLYQRMRPTPTIRDIENFLSDYHQVRTASKQKKMLDEYLTNGTSLKQIGALKLFIDCGFCIENKTTKKPLALK